MEKFERSIWELDPVEQAHLKSLKSIEDLKDVQCVRHWMKDGLPCVALSINGIEMAFSELDTDDAAALLNPKYTDSKTTLLKQLRSRLLQLQGGDLDDEDEFEAEADIDDSAGGSYGDYYGDY